jgi:hypothetical protein
MVVEIRSETFLQLLQITTNIVNTFRYIVELANEVRCSDDAGLVGVGVATSSLECMGDG